MLYMHAHDMLKCMRMCGGHLNGYLIDYEVPKKVIDFEEALDPQSRHNRQVFYG